MRREEEKPDNVDPFNEFVISTHKALLKERIILLNGDVKENIIERMVIPLFKMNSKDEKKKVTILLNSYGGSMEDAQAVIDTMLSMKTPITTKVLGKAMSAAFDIFMAGDHRVLLQNSILMMHCGGYNYGHRKLSDVQVEAKLNEEYFRRWAKYYAARTKIAEQTWYDMIASGKDVYFFPEEALAKGLAHAIHKHSK
jgi:ATP-dependent Clp protease protease subunit